MTEQKMQMAVVEFAQAIDVADTVKAASYLHDTFRVLLNNFPETGKVTELNKAQYLGMVSAGKVGGIARKIEILMSDCYNGIGAVRMHSESVKGKIENYYTLIWQGEDWYIVNDVPQLS